MASADRGSPEWMYQTWKALVSEFGYEEAADRLAWLMPSTDEVRTMAAYAGSQAEQLLYEYGPDEGPQWAEDDGRSADLLEEVVHIIEASIRANIRG